MKEGFLFCVLMLSSMFEWTRPLLQGLKNGYVDIKGGLGIEIGQEFISLIVLMTSLSLYKKIFGESIQTTINKIFKVKDKDNEVD